MLGHESCPLECGRTRPLWMGATRRAQGKRRPVAALQNVQSPDSRERGNRDRRCRQRRNWIPARAPLGRNDGKWRRPQNAVRIQTANLVRLCVIPAKAGIQTAVPKKKASTAKLTLDSGSRASHGQNDGGVGPIRIEPKSLQVPATSSLAG